MSYPVRFLLSLVLLPSLALFPCFPPFFSSIISIYIFLPDSHTHPLTHSLTQMYTISQSHINLFYYFKIVNAKNIPVQINCELNPESMPCEMTKDFVLAWCFLSTYMNAHPFGAHSHLCAFET